MESPQIYSRNYVTPEIWFENYSLNLFPVKPFEGPFRRVFHVILYKVQFLFIRDASASLFTNNHAAFSLPVFAFY